MRLALIALLAVGCSHYGFQQGPFTVVGGTLEEQAQAVQIAEAGRRLYPDGALKWAMTIRLSPDIDFLCGWELPEPEGVLHYAGCVADGINVLWPHPKLPPGSDLTRSALAHELSHVAMPLCTEAQADASALLIVQEYRKGVP